ncbi:MAG TPA: LuxR C-terminal-related transcriptional regulator [Steroidobacteraceae bacterium]|nr:LuxR C-terminal-related transcriptional regulator [Steroidobacteraceae bacterium]
MDPAVLAAVKSYTSTAGRFRPAVVAPHELVRDRLLRRVTGENQLGSAHCTLILGPAGFGKTTLLAHVYRQLTGQGDPAIWLECNEHDADPSQLLHSLYAAGSAAGVNPKDLEFSTADFAERAARLGANVCLCIDGLEHVIGTESESLLPRLLLALPARARVVLASRRAPTAWFVEHELRGLAATIQADDLRLTQGELAELLSERLAPEQIAQVAALTEGWPVAVQLTRLRARDMPSVTEMLERLERQGLGLFEYLAHRVLEALTGDQRKLLTVTSILPALTPALANALMERDDGYALMSGVLKLSPIVNVTSDSDFTLRLHPLLRQYLRNDLARAGKEYESTLHRRAAQVLAAAGQTLESIRHFLQAGELRLAVDQFERAGGDQMLLSSGPSHVQTLVDVLPPGARKLSLKLQFTDYMLALIAGRASLARELYARLQPQVRKPAAARHDPGSGWKKYVAAYLSVADDLLADLHGGARSRILERCATVERLAHLSFPRNELHRGLILAVEILLFLRHASTKEARRAFQEYVALCERNQIAAHLPSVSPQRGWLAFFDGDLDAASRFLERTQPKRLDRFAEPEPLLAQLSSALVALIHYERNELDSAFAVVDSTTLDPDRTLPESWALLCRVRALSLDALGHSSETDESLAYEYSQATRRDARRLVLIITATRMELSLRREAPDLAALKRLERVFDHELKKTEASWLFLYTLSRAVIPALVVARQHDRARELATRLIAQTEARGHALFKATAQIMLANAEEDSGNSARAREHLKSALEITAALRTVRPYIDLWSRASPALLWLVSKPLPSEIAEHIRQVLRALDAARPTTLEGWSELSERERDVLSALAAHTTTKGMARSLGLSPETVKHHLKRIFSKLGVHSRAAALEKIAQHPV